LAAFTILRRSGNRQRCITDMRARPAAMPQVQHFPEKQGILLLKLLK
jgi:hypothetical protein